MPNANSDLPRLTAPQLAVSLNNRAFDPKANTWALSKDVALNLGQVVSRLAVPLQEPYRKVMQYYAENYSAKYCAGIHSGVHKFLTDINVNQFSVTALRNYRKALGRSQECRLATIRAFLLRWHDQGFPGVSEEVAEWLRSVRLRGNVKGRAVLSLDTQSGPFDDQELAAVLNAAPQEYAQGRIDLAGLVFTLLLSYSGRRPIQLSLLRLGDLIQTTTRDGRRIEAVQVPRVKQRGRPHRSQFKHFWLAPDVHRLLLVQRDVVTKQVEARVGRLPGNVTAELPFFPDWARFHEIPSIEQLQHALRNDTLHAPTQQLTAALRKVRAISARTGCRLHITPRRFRYTLGTRAARQGYGTLVIAELLDHSDVQNAWVYTRDHPNFRIKIDEAVGQQLAPLAHAFAGRLVDREADARHGEDPSMRLGTLEQKIGTCGSNGFCGAEASACYTCMHFQAWVDAPHHKVLESTLQRRQQMKDAGASEMVLGATDPIIHGVRAVMAACEARKAELAGVRNG